MLHHARPSGPEAPEARTFEVRVPGACLRGIEVGASEAPVVVALPAGPGGSHGPLRPHLDRLAACAGVRVVYFDPRGCGASTREPDASRTLHALVGDVEAVAAARAGAARVSVLGWSFGAALARHHARAFPARVGRLVLVAPGGPAGVEVAREVLAARTAAAVARAEVAELRHRAALMRQNGHPDAVRAEFEAAVAPWLGDVSVARRLVMPAQDEGAERALAEGGHVAAPPLATDAGSALPPTLVVCGDADPVPPDAVQRLAARLGARCVVLAGAGHAPFAETPDAFDAAVAPFLTGGAGHGVS